MPGDVPTDLQRPISGHLGRTLTWSGLRVSGVLVIVTAVYCALPVSIDITGIGLVLLTQTLLAALTVLFVRQTRKVQHAQHPYLRAGEALVVGIWLFVLVTALVYLIVAAGEPEAFSQPMTKINAVYFAMTVFATVGFGDITAITPRARIFVTGQMLMDLLIVGIAARGLVRAAQEGIERRRTGDHGSGH